MNNGQFRIAVIKGDGIGVDVTDATLAVIDAAERRVGDLSFGYEFLDAGAAYFRANGCDMAPGAEDAAEAADAIFLGAIGLPTVRHGDGTEIAGDVLHALVHEPRTVNRTLTRALNFLAANAGKAKMQRDRKTGRLKLGLEHVHVVA